jgi:hypothetical protein
VIPHPTLLAVALAGALIACMADLGPGHAAIVRPDTSQPATQPPSRQLRTDGTHFVTPDGRDFQWRGITAFRLVDYVADGEEALASRYLTWAASQGLTVVRVLTMMSGQFDLKPADGRRALPRVMQLAAELDLYVEVVALAGTASIPVNLQEHVDEIGRILVAHPNGLLEIANEPVHPSQSPEVHKPEVLKALADRVPSDVPVALGSIERGDGFGGGDYVTWHAPRDAERRGWGHVLALAKGAELLHRWKKPVISDEPIGAGAEVEPGRRDNAPSRFRAAALLTRLAGLGATFHYEGGLQARVPTGPELECFSAWNEAWTLLPPDVERHGVFRASVGPASIVTGYDRERVKGIYERADATTGWLLVVGDQEGALTLSNGWIVRETRRIEGGRLVTVARSRE